jgi:MYXO-CTERM domain-containing protein
MIVKLLSGFAVSLLGSTVALADPVPIEPGDVPSPWTLPIALAVLVAIAAYIFWRRRR